MADVVFLLLIYFLLTSTFVAQVGLKVDLPASSSDQPSNASHSITITADGQYAWDQTVLDNRDQLIPLIEDVLTDDDNENDVLTLRTDKQVIMEEAAFAISEIARHGGQVVIMTKKQ